MASSPLDLTLGVLLIGIFFNTFLYGLVFYQFARYLTIPFKDPIWMKLFVLVLFLLDTVHSGAIIYMAYYYCVTQFGNAAAQAIAIWPYGFTSSSISIVAFMTHLFLTKRIHSLIANNVLTVSLVAMAVANFIVGFHASIRAWMMPRFVDQAVLIPNVTAWFSLSFANDFILAGILAWALYQSKSGIKRTDTVIGYLIRGAITTGLFAALFNMGSLLSFRFGQTTNFAAFFADPIGRIYTNTLMATLLERDDLRKMMSGGAVVDMDSRSQVSSGLRSRKTGESVPMHSIVVKTDVYTDSDRHEETGKDYGKMRV